MTSTLYLGCNKALRSLSLRSCQRRQSREVGRWGFHLHQGNKSHFYLSPACSPLYEWILCVEAGLLFPLGSYELPSSPPLKWCHRIPSRESGLLPFATMLPYSHPQIVSVEAMWGCFTPLIQPGKDHQSFNEKLELLLMTSIYKELSQLGCQ